MLVPFQNPPEIFLRLDACLYLHKLKADTIPCKYKNVSTFIGKQNQKISTSSLHLLLKAFLKNLICFVFTYNDNSSHGWRNQPSFLTNKNAAADNL